MTAFVDSSDPLISEFEAMDMDGDGLLTKNEVFEMLIFQGVLLSEEEMKVRTWSWFFSFWRTHFIITSGNNPYYIWWIDRLV